MNICLQIENDDDADLEDVRSITVCTTCSNCL